MRHSAKLSAILPPLVFLTVAPLFADGSERRELPSVEEMTEGLHSRRGLLDLHLDAKSGKVFLELPSPNDAGEIGRYLYVEGLASGLGSNPVGLDRGQLGPARLIAIRRLGGRVLIEQPNLAYRATSDNPEERRAVEQSFATSVLWAGPVIAGNEDGRTLVDFTGFLVRDAHGVSARLQANEQGSFALDGERSVVDLQSCLAFPDNVEFESLLTYAGDRPGGHVRQVTPAPDSISLVQHHSIIRLPAPGYEPRAFDPREGSSAIRFLDYAQPLDQPIERRWIVRHRLKKKKPGAAVSAAIDPIVYYVDRGAPEPVRSALIDGARWWAEAFEAAGFADAFRVELLPEGVHPLDVRYNVIQWVHRSTRGWSYGGGVVDPRTGEMVKGHVSLGSLRVRQDRLLFEGLVGADGSGSGSAADPVQLALARIRQLSAHEVGHTLGLAHNFAASTYGRASVMDYPAPWVQVGDDGSLDVSQAYAVGVGAWDVHAIRYAYSQFARGADEAAELRKITEQGLAQGLLFIGDKDARPAGSAHPAASLWDNGADPLDELERVLAVRRVALDRFGEENIAEGRPLALLEEVLAPVYFYHRYQLQAAAKVIGGVDFRYAVRGDGQPPATPVDGPTQRRAIDLMLDTLEPDQLDLSDALLARLLPRPFGYGDNRERFDGRTDPVFDPLAAAGSAAGLTLRSLLHPRRCARMIDLHRRDGELPELAELLETLVNRLFPAEATPGERQAAILREVQRVAVASLIELSRNPAASGEVRARVDLTLAGLYERLVMGLRTAQALHLSETIRRYLERDHEASSAAIPEAPPGSPIGNAPPRILGGCSREAGPRE